MYVPLGKSEKLEELSTWLDWRGGLSVGSAAGPRVDAIRRGKEWKPCPCAPSQAHWAAGQNLLPVPSVLTAAVTGTAGISIPGIMGGTIPGIYGYKEDKNQLPR